MKETTDVNDIFAHMKRRQLHRARSFEKDWLPDDPLFKQHEWKKIKDSLGELCPSIDFGTVSDDLMVCVGNYRAAALNERPERITGHRYVSDKNRGKLDKAVKVLTETKNIYAGKSNTDPRTQKKYRKESQALLQNNLLRELVFVSDASIEGKMQSVIDDLDQNTTTMDSQSFNEVVDAVIVVLQKQRKMAAKKGAPTKQALHIMLAQLEKIWNKATGQSATASEYKGKLVSSFYGFVEAVLMPISEQLEDKTDSCALRSAVWDHCNKKSAL